LTAVDTAPLAAPNSALAIGAHPDDVEFGCGGLLAKWADSGCTVHHLICTDGSKGTWDPAADIDDLIGRRQDEQREAARRIAGPMAGEVRFLGRSDGELDNSVETRREIVRVIRELRPDVVVGHDPWKRYRLHPDHRNAGLLTCDSIVAARDPHFFTDLGLRPHRPHSLLLFEADVPNHIEDVSAHVETKIAALLAHESQFESTMHATDAAGIDAFGERIRQRLRDTGGSFGMDAAEAFALISDL
jgi:LmbE family N-acetylglucosaminyl deacetylase